MSKKVFDIIKLLVIMLLLFGVFSLWDTNNKLESKFESYKKNGEYVTLYQSKTITQLKRENRELYDSIKEYKSVKQAIIIKYKYIYSGDTVFIYRKLPTQDSVYEFSKKTDTISYTAQVKTASKPEWFKVDFTINDKLTIINREENGDNELTINTNGGIIEGTSVFNKKENKNSFIDRFSVGVNAGVGYGIITKKPDLYIGVGVSYRLNKIK